MSTDYAPSSVAELLRSPFEELLMPLTPNTLPNVEPLTPVPGLVTPTPTPITDAEMPGMIGTPMHDAQEWDGQQMFANDCAIRSQQFILEQFTGEKFDEASLVKEATNAGIYTDGGGTHIADVGKLLEMHGIHVHHVDHASVADLADELAHGHKVICGVDSEKLWGQLADGAPGQMDHAVVVSGIDTSDPNNVRVIVDDPGTGQISTYSMDHFLASWSDGNYPLVATDDSAPVTAPGMANFDYLTGHIADVTGVPYEEFQTMREQPGFIDAFSHLVQELAGLGQETHPESTMTDAVSGSNTYGLSTDEGVHLNSVDVTPGSEDGHMLVNISADIDTSHLDTSAAAAWPSGGVSIQDVHLTPGDSEGLYHMSVLADVTSTGDEAFHG